MLNVLCDFAMGLYTYGGTGLVFRAVEQLSKHGLNRVQCAASNDCFRVSGKFYSVFIKTGFCVACSFSTKTVRPDFGRPCR